MLNEQLCRDKQTGRKRNDETENKKTGTETKVQGRRTNRKTDREENESKTIIVKHTFISCYKE